MVNLLTELDFESIFNSLPAPFLVMDRDFTIVAVNQAFLDATRRPPESLIGINIFVAFPGPEESRKVLQESLERARDKGIADEMPAVSYAITVNGVRGAPLELHPRSGPRQERENRVRYQEHPRYLGTSSIEGLGGASFLGPRTAPGLCGSAARFRACSQSDALGDGSPFAPSGHAGS